MRSSVFIRVTGLLCFLTISAHALESRESSFDPLHHSGPASPYFNAPSQFGIPVETPAGCIVEQAAYIVRHGSRFPEPGSFSGWQVLFNKLQNVSYTAKGKLNFLPSWVPPVDDVAHEPLFLSATGSSEAFRLGADLRMRYNLTQGGSNFTVWSAGQQRCVDTATYWLRGYLGQGDYLASPGENRGTVVFMPDSVNSTGADSLTPSAACPAYSSSEGSNTSTAFRATYQNKIAERLNRYLEGLELDATDIGIMQDLCGFSFEINRDHRFCDSFEESEWLDYEYAHDLNYYYGSGPGNPLSATTGYPWLKAVTDLLVAGPQKAPADGTFVPPPLLVSFTHDNDIPPIISALGIMNSSFHKGVYPLSLTSPNPRRTFRASNIVSFLGHVALERLSCQPPLGESVKHVAGQLPLVPGRGSDAKKYILVRVNNAPVPIPSCASGPSSSCPLAEFEAYVNGPLAAKAGDFVQKCGLSNVTGTADTVDFFTNPHSTAANTSTFLLGIDPQVGTPST